MVVHITGWYRKRRLLVSVVVGVVVTVAIVYGLWLWLIATPTDFDHKLAFIRTVGSIAGGLVLIIGAISAWRTLQVNRQGQITDRFTRAIDQLGKTDNKYNKIEEIRLGGIYALEQIAVDEPDKYHWPIMQVFAAYLRKHASWRGDPLQVIEPDADIRTVLYVIGRRSRYFKAGENEYLVLNRTDFSNYVFPDEAHLEGADLSEAHLESTMLYKAQLKEAQLVGAHLEGAYLVSADLRDADLRGAYLEGAYLRDADLRGANLGEAHLTATYIPGAKLQGVKNLDSNRLEEANGAYDTEVGETLRPKWWDSPLGSDTPLDPGNYSIKVWKTLFYFNNLGEGWHSDLFLPFAFSLTPAGAHFTGSSIYFCSGPKVCDPQKPKEAFALVSAPEDMVSWFRQHPYLQTSKPEPVAIGGVKGEQFDAEVKHDTPDQKIILGVEGPVVPIFPLSPRFTSLGPTKGKKMRVIVLEYKHEPMLILNFSPADEFDQFKVRVDKEVLATLYG